MNSAKNKIMDYHNKHLQDKNDCEWDFLYDLYYDFYKGNDQKIFLKYFYSSDIPIFALDELREFMAENNLFGKTPEEVITLWTFYET